MIIHSGQSRTRIEEVRELYFPFPFLPFPLFLSPLPLRSRPLKYSYGACMLPQQGLG